VRNETAAGDALNRVHAIPFEHGEARLPWTEHDHRRRDEPAESAYFGEPFLWTALFRRDARPES
jgi:hypothetical protein